jgi:hypothetical protein
MHPKCIFRRNIWRSGILDATVQQNDDCHTVNLLKFKNSDDKSCAPAYMDNDSYFMYDSTFFTHCQTDA